ncbi:MAG TPA: hypothetical protein VFP81_05985 [Propionibacteriaceae bacterium]|nr:hypothetical protein [Propionibacteriaceae bacterium]
MNDSALSFRRWAVIFAAGLSGVIVLISMLFDPAPDAEGRELIQAYAANDRAQGVHSNLIHYGFALFAPVAYAMVGLVRRRGAWIANLAGVLAVLGLSTLPGLVLFDYFSVAVEHVAGLEAAVNAEDAVEKLPGFAAVTAPAFISAILAVPVATLALWRARLVTWWLPPVAAAAFLGPNLLPGPAIVAFSVMAAGMLIVGWALWRIPAAAWYGINPSDQLTAAQRPSPDRR